MAWKSPKQKKYYEKNREPILRKMKASQKAHPEWFKRHYEQNKEAILQRAKAYRVAQSEETKMQTKKQAKIWRDAHREQLWKLNRVREWKKEYGLTPETVLEMFEQQSRQCAICHRNLFLGEYGKRATAHIDHCHKTGKIRGILCVRCNVGLGHLEDEVWKESAIRYLANSSLL
jgi:hypothetical protein